MSSSQTGHAVSKQRISSRTRSGNALLFARNFFRHPRMLGSIIPSSRFLIKQVLAPGGHFVTYGAMSKQPLTLPASAGCVRKSPPNRACRTLNGYPH